MTDASEPSALYVGPRERVAEQVDLIGPPPTTPFALQLIGERDLWPVIEARSLSDAQNKVSELAELYQGIHVVWCE